MTHQCSASLMAYVLSRADCGGGQATAGSSSSSDMLCSPPTPKNTVPEWTAFMCPFCSVLERQNRTEQNRTEDQACEVLIRPAVPHVHSYAHPSEDRPANQSIDSYFIAHTCLFFVFTRTHPSYHGHGRQKDGVGSARVCQHTRCRQCKRRSARWQGPWVLQRREGVDPTSSNAQRDARDASWHHGPSG